MQDGLMEMKAVVIDEMPNPVVIFDEKNEVKLYNQAAEQYLNVSENMPIADFVKGTNLRYILTPERHRMGQTKEFHMAMHSNGRVFLIHGKEWWENEVYTGMFLVYDDITDQENMKDEATYYASHDKLTGLWNRDFFFEIASKVLMDNAGEPFLMIATDISQFKLFNEILGIPSGNELLLAIAEGFRKNRKKDWVFARIAGDRFALLMPKKDFDETEFLEAWGQVFQQLKYSLRIHNYYGVFEITDSFSDPEEAYNKAYLTLESIKGRMDGYLAYYDEKIRNRRVAERLTADDLEYALVNDEFIIYIQPQVDTANGKVVGGETLVRWNSHKRGIVPPSEFVPLFEKNGMITRMDYHVWGLACRQLAKWKKEGHQDRSLSINISAKNFYLSDLYERLTGLVERYEVDPKRLKLEITETAFVLDVKKQMELVHRLQDYGFLVEMDDFGSGYSSLNNLKDISIDILKLDMAFFRETDMPERSAIIIEHMVNMAKELKMPVIAEGVENEEQVKFLASIGCQLVQGFYYSKPMAVEDFDAYLESHGTEDMFDFVHKFKGPATPSKSSKFSFLNFVNK